MQIIDRNDLKRMSSLYRDHLCSFLHVRCLICHTPTFPPYEGMNPKWKDRSLMPNADAHGTPNLRTNTDKQRSFPLTSPRRWPCEGVPTQSRRLAVDDVSLLMGVPDWLAITLSTDELHPLVAMPTTEPIQVRQMRCQDHPSNPPNIIVYKALFTFYII